MRLASQAPCFYCGTRPPRRTVAAYGRGHEDWPIAGEQHVLNEVATTRREFVRIELVKGAQVKGAQVRVTGMKSDMIRDPLSGHVGRAWFRS